MKKKLALARSWVNSCARSLERGSANFSPSSNSSSISILRWWLPLLLLLLDHRLAEAQERFCAARFGSIIIIVITTGMVKFHSSMCLHLVCLNLNLELKLAFWSRETTAKNRLDNIKVPATTTTLWKTTPTTTECSSVGAIQNAISMLLVDLLPSNSTISKANKLLSLCLDVFVGFSNSTKRRQRKVSKRCSRVARQCRDLSGFWEKIDFLVVGTS